MQTNNDSVPSSPLGSLKGRQQEAVKLLEDTEVETGQAARLGKRHPLVLQEGALGPAEPMWNRRTPLFEQKCRFRTRTLQRQACSQDLGGQLCEMLPKALLSRVNSVCSLSAPQLFSSVACLCPFSPLSSSLTALWFHPFQLK